MSDWDISPTVVLAACAATTILYEAGKQLYKKAMGEAKNISRISAADSLASIAIGKIDLLGRDLAEHKVEDARLFSRLETLVSEQGKAQIRAEDRMTAAIDNFSETLSGFGREINGLNERIDRALENRR